MVLGRALDAGQTLAWRPRSLAAAVYALALLLLVSQIPEPAWRWSEEAQARKEVSEFLRDDAAIRQAWQKILNDSKRGGVSFDELAGRIDTAIGDRYEESFEHLSQFPINPALPSAKTLEMLREYAELRRDASRSLAEGLGSKDSAKIREAIAMEKKARELQSPARVPQAKPKP